MAAHPLCAGRAPAFCGFGREDQELLIGVLLTALPFTRRVSAVLDVEHEDAADGTRTVQFANSFDYLHAPGRVVIDLSEAHFRDTTAVAALDRVVLKLRRHGAEVEVIGLNRASRSLVDRLGTHDEAARAQGPFTP
ncbi:STAS domain-containing protein [Luteimonas granuli]|uniref:STAS domain-containing protein n=1 Tax=Luteimonas granuli TaxID=1176533 RepID=A0A518N4F1_9GAMM|nr:STAS domain-containing protein [Luteimonas granuli]